ncbi:hypothetical protein [Methylorubrum thiocyanatum]|uniref:hypothetical protein n=1 Tax=Methylorubrum thiocyanatum TaxID=47958 RepID=UPI003F7D3D6D
MPRFASTAPAAVLFALEAHIEELRAELSSVACPTERREIESDLRTAREQFAKLKAEG